VIDNVIINGGGFYYPPYFGRFILEQYIDIRGVCAITKLKEPTIRKYVSGDLIPYLRVGRLIRFRSSQIEAWLLGKERNTVTDDEVCIVKAVNGELFEGMTD
jgi:excisionase family DNA binding protein